MRGSDGITDSVHEFEQAPGTGEGQGSLAVHGVVKSWTQPSD